MHEAPDSKGAFKVPFRLREDCLRVIRKDFKAHNNLFIILGSADDFL